MLFGKNCPPTMFLLFLIYLRTGQSWYRGDYSPTRVIAGNLDVIHTAELAELSTNAWDLNSAKHLQSMAAVDDGARTLTEEDDYPLVDMSKYIKFIRTIFQRRIKGFKKKNVEQKQ